jgi:hypothetical protein
MPITETYADLKAHFDQKGCLVTSAPPPTSVSVKQGSLWGISPQSAKKTVTCNLTQKGSQTRFLAVQS